jgi:hypothetical protein
MAKKEGKGIKDNAAIEDGNSDPFSSDGGPFVQKDAASPAKGKSPLSDWQKIALIGAAAIIAIVLAAPFFAPAPEPTPLPPQIVTSQEFLFNLNMAKSVGVFMDTRAVQDMDLKRKILQCGADFSAGFASTTGLESKERIIAACDDAGCILSNSTLNATRNASTEEIMSALGNTVYIHIKGGESGSPAFYSNRLEFTLSKLSNSSCHIGSPASNTTSQTTLFPGNGSNSPGNNSAIGNESNPSSGNNTVAPSNASSGTIDDIGSEATIPAEDMPGYNGTRPDNTTGGASGPQAMPALNGSVANATPQNTSGPQK